MDYKSVCILGRQPAIGRAELESLYGSSPIRRFRHGVLLDLPADRIDFSKLGGSTRLAAVISTVTDTKWPTIASELQQIVLDDAAQLEEEGKLTFGVSIFGNATDKKSLTKCLIELKKRIKKSGRSVRIVPNNAPELSAAQVLYNKLTSSHGWEFLILPNGNETIIAKTVAIQDIEAYSARDQARPKRDALVGMLPPKLAQIIINLAIGKNSENACILDPFCGTGVILQEAALMGFDSVGTDIKDRMIEYSTENLLWLRQKWPKTAETHVRIELGDATDHTWPENVTHVACEGYLGQPLSSLPPQDKLTRIIKDADSVMHGFLKNAAQKLPRGTRMCIGMPAWRKDNGFLHLPTLDQIEDLGYNRVSFVHATHSELIYFREDQIVGRELVVLEKR